MKKFKDFCENIGESRDIDDIPAPELNSLLCAFFVKVKRKDGKEYEPGSLSSFLNTFTRVLADKGSKINLKKDTEFEKTRKVLGARRKQLTKQGYGNKPNTVGTLEPEEINKLYETILEQKTLKLFGEQFGGMCLSILDSVQETSLGN